MCSVCLAKKPNRLHRVTIIHKCSEYGHYGLNTSIKIFEYVMKIEGVLWLFAKMDCACFQHDE